MSDIDPFKHPPVYKYEQVVTQEELRRFEKAYRESEYKLRDRGYLTEANIYCVSHTLLGGLLEWIIAGKPDFEIGELDDGDN